MVNIPILIEVPTEGDTSVINVDDIIEIHVGSNIKKLVEITVAKGRYYKDIRTTSTKEQLIELIQEAVTGALSIANGNATSSTYQVY